MSATSSSSSSDLLIDQITEEYVQRLRRGEQPQISEYTERYPKIANQLKSRIKCLQMLEQVGSNSRRLQLLIDEIQLNNPDLQNPEFIGVGGMGAVWKATQLSLERTVAIKVLQQQNFDWEQSRERFLEEARIASMLSHEHIVPVHNVFPDAAHPYYIMQFIDGCPLSLVIEAWKQQRDGTQPTTAAPASAPSQPASDPPRRLLSCSSIPERSFRKIAEWMRQAATTVHFAHQNNVLHRDLKPSNFLIDEQQKIWLTDFGLAKRPRKTLHTAAGQAPGTLRYMSPEQCDGRATTLSDVYSLGVTLYEMLALTPAFQDDSSLRLQQRIRSGSCPHLRTHDPAIPRDLLVITHKAMAVQPEDRYESAKALADDLQRFLDGKPILARPMSAPEQLWRLIGRHKLVSAVTTLAAVLLIATSTIAIYSEYLRVIGLESEIGRLLSEAIDLAKSQLPGQRTHALEKIKNAIRLADQTPDPTTSKTRIRDTISTVLGTPEMVLSEPLPQINNPSLKAFVVARDRTRLVVQADDNILEVRDGNTAALQAQITLGGDPLDFAISADGCCLLVSSPAPDTNPANPANPLSQTTPTQQLACWDLTQPQPTLRWTIPGLQARAITLLPNHSQLVTADHAGSIHRIELSTGRLLQSYPCPGPATDIQLRPHPQQPIVAVCSGYFHEIQFLNLDSGQLVGHISRNGVSGFDWHPQGHLLALHDQLLEVELLHWPSMQPHKTILKGVGLTHCRFSPDGRWLAVASWSTTGTQTQLIAIRIEDQYTLTCPWPYLPDGKSHQWNNDGDELATLYYADRIYRATLHDPQLFQYFDPDHSIADTPQLAPATNLPLIVANTLGVPGQVLNLHTGTTLTAPLPDKRNSSLPYRSHVAWNTDRITSLDAFSEKLWNIQPHFTQQGDLLLNTKSRIRLPLSHALADLTSDGSRIFSVSPAGRVLYSPTDDPLAFRSLPRNFTDLTAASRTGRLVFCWRKSDSVLYDCESRQIVATFLSRSNAMFSSDERFLLVSSDPQAPDSSATRFLYDISNRSIIRSLPHGPAFSNFSDSGELLAIRFLSEQFIRLIQTSTGTTLLRLPIEADNRGTPYFTDNDRRLFIHSVGQTSNRLYSINLQALMTQFDSLGLPVPGLLPAPEPAQRNPQAGLWDRALSARTLTFSSSTTPLHRHVTTALCNSLLDLAHRSPTPKRHFASLLTSLCCDALELGCLDAASLALDWQQRFGSPSAGVTAIRASLLRRQNQPAQALQLLQTLNNPADCDATAQFNKCLALQQLDRFEEAQQAADKLLQQTDSDTLKFALGLVMSPPANSSLQSFLADTPKLLVRAQDTRSHQLALLAAQQATASWPDVADCWQIQALAEICNGLPAAATSSLANARRLKQNRNDATLQLIESAIHLHNEDFQAWFISLLKTNQLLDQQDVGLIQLYWFGVDLPLAITLQVPVRAGSINGRLYRWLLLAESQLLGHTHIDVLLKTRTGM